MTEGVGIAGVFATPEAVTNAARRLRDLGFSAIDAYTPYPVDELDDIVSQSRGRLLPAAMFAAAIVGAAAGFFIQYWDEVLSYPINVGGRPYNSWPAFIVGAFEIMLLFTVAAGLLALFALCRLPLLYHPVFDTPDFERASCDRFMLCVQASDPGFEPTLIRRVFERLGAERIAELGR